MTYLTRRAALAAAAVLTLVAAAGCGGKTGGDDGNVAAPAATASAESPTPAATTGVPAPIAERFGAAPKPSRTTRAPHPPKPSRRPPVEKELPPPPPPPPPASECTKPKYEGEQASKTEAKQALTAAANYTFWPNSSPELKVPVNLVKATAWQESGWQSNIIACDGGVGLMQVMQGTATWMNNRFQREDPSFGPYDINDYKGNAMLGTALLAWSIKYFGDVYFNGDYTLYTDEQCADVHAPCLINAVIASYNYGFGAVDTDNGIYIPNPQYVANVRALMTQCECLAY